jgi:hypothetical protein
MTILFIVPAFSAFSDPVSEFNATMTQDGVFYMRGPSFVGPDYGIYEMGGAGSEVIVLSRTSFTDRMAGVPEDYWYLVMYRHCGAEITGYIHGSALRIDPGRTIPVFDPAGATPSTTAPAFVRLTLTASIDKERKKTTGTIIVPPGKRAVRFRLNWFGSNFFECPEWLERSNDGFFIAPASAPGTPLFAYKIPVDAGPGDFDTARDTFFSLDLGPGAYRVDVTGDPCLGLKITYDIEDAPKPAPGL